MVADRKLSLLTADNKPFEMDLLAQKRQSRLNDSFGENKISEISEESEEVFNADLEAELESARVRVESDSLEGLAKCA